MECVVGVDTNGIDLNEPENPKFRTVILYENGKAEYPEERDFPEAGDVVIALPHNLCLHRFTRLPPVDEKNIPAMVKYEATQEIPFDIEEVLWKYHRIPGYGPEIRVSISAIRKNIASTLEGFIQTRKKPKLVTTLDSINSVVKFPEKNSELILYNAERNGILLMVRTPEGNYWSRPIPVGIRPERKEEDLQALNVEVLRSVGYFTSTHRDEPEIKGGYVLSSSKEGLTADEIIKRCPEFGLSTDFPLHPGIEKIKEGFEIAYGAAAYRMFNKDATYLSDKTGVERFNVGRALQTAAHITLTPVRAAGYILVGIGSIAKRND
jgi:hypothetical protein